MDIPAFPPNEAERQCVLDRTGLLDSPSEARFDRITHLAQQYFQVPIALISLVDRDRQWFKSRQGLDAEETPRSISFCGHAILQSEVFIVENALLDTRFADNPLVTGAPHIRFYAGAPLRINSVPIGTLCLIDTQPRTLSADQQAQLIDFAATVAELIEADGLADEIRHERDALSQLSKHHKALMLLNTIAFQSATSLDEKIHSALASARDYLAADVAIISEIDHTNYTVRWLSAPVASPIQIGMQFPLQQTWCQLIYSGNTHEMFIADCTEEQWRHHACYQSNPLGNYMGMLIEVNGVPFGTLNFSSGEARMHGFDESEKLFVRLFSRWLSDLLTNNLNSERLIKLMAQLPGVTYQFRRYPDGRMTFPFSSSNIEQLYGISPAQAAKDATPAFSRIHPDDIPQVSASIEYSADTLEYWQATYRVSDSHHGYRWVSGQARPERLVDGSVLWHGYLHDVNDEEEARIALKENERRLRGLFEFSPIGIALNDYATGQFIDLNNALLAPTGYTRDEFVALSYWDLTPQEYQPEEEKALTDLSTSGRYGPLEKEYIRKDGSRYPVRLQGMLSQDGDGNSVIWSLIEDITERRKLDKMKDQFVATVSHELRTPLTSITGALGLVLGGAAGELPEKAQVLLGTADRNAKRLAHLINDLLDIEKLVAGKMPIHLQNQPLAPLLQEAMDAMQHYHEQYHVHIQPPSVWPDCHVNVDGARLLQALTNLLSNAIKFSPDGGTVELHADALDDVVIIRVRDHGTGIDPDFRPQLFKRFSQADSSDTRKLQGTGLGLAITSEICQKLHGSVEYRDADGGGAEFCVTLPKANAL